MTLITIILAVLILPLASYRICRFLIEDYLFDSIRNRIWKRFPPERSKFGYIFTCYHCLSIWVAAFMIVLFCVFPVPTLIVASVLAISAVVGFIDHYLTK